MPLNNPTPGPNSVAEYQVSAIPWVSSSSGLTGIQRFSFPFVSSFLVIKNTSAAGNISVGFTYAGVGGANGFSLAPNESFAGELRVNQLFVSGSATYNVGIIAGLTTILAKDFPILTASAGFQGVG
jgi:hypothetical protein